MKEYLEKIREIITNNRLLALTLTIMLFVGASGTAYAIITSNLVSGETEVQGVEITGIVPQTCMRGDPLTYDITYDGIPEGNPSGNIYVSITNTTLGSTNIDTSLISVAITKDGSTTTLTPSKTGKKATYSLATTFLSIGGSYEVSITYLEGVIIGSTYIEDNWITIV